jgi:dTDP-4-amino-4,6-dideoxygalactose transaminase
MNLELEEGEVILPSFTFSATGHALLRNGLTPRFVDIDPHTLLLDPQKAEEAITPRTVGILPVHTFGNPCYPERLEALAQAHGLKLVFDSAHALGATFNGRMVATFGDAEVFSLSPTKLVVAAEGGVVTTPDDELARRLRIGRDYGNPGNYDCEYAGISARMSEFHALLAIETFRRLPQALDQRGRLVSLYHRCLGTLPGLAFQRIVPGAQSTYKDFAILVEKDEFGLTRDELAKALEAEGVMTRKYFDPPLHRQRAYAAFRAEYEGHLPVTEAVSHKVLCLPLASHYQPETVERICGAIERLYVHRAEVRKALSA